MKYGAIPTQNKETPPSLADDVKTYMSILEKLDCFTQEDQKQNKQVHSRLAKIPICLTNPSFAKSL